MVLDQIKRFMNQGKYQEALDLTEEILHEELKGVYLVRIYQKMEKNDTALQLVRRKLQDLNPQYETYEFLLRTVLIGIHNNLAQLEQADIEIKKCKHLLSIGQIELGQDLSNELTEWKGVFFNLCGLIQWQHGKHEEALVEFDQALQNFDEIEDLRGQANIFNNKGLIYRELGSQQDAISNLTNAVNLYSTLEFKGGIIAANINFGTIYRDLGQYKRALNHYFTALNTHNELDKMTKNLGTIYNNIGEIYRIFGQEDEAMNYLTKGLEIRQNLNIKQDIAFSLLEIGYLYRQIGELDKSKQYLEDALEIHETVRNYNHLSEVLFRLIEIAIELGELKGADRYFQSLKGIADQNQENRRILLFRKIAETTIMMNNVRFRDRIPAQNILENIVEKYQDLDAEIILTAMLRLGKLYLDEIKVAQDENLLRDMEDLIERMYQLSIKASFHQFIIKSLLLNARYQFVTSNFENVKIIIEQAKHHAEVIDLEFLKYEVTMEEIFVQNEIQKLSTIVDQSNTHFERLKSILLTDYLNTIHEWLRRNKK